MIIYNIDFYFSVRLRIEHKKKSTRSGKRKCSKPGKSNKEKGKFLRFYLIVGFFNVSFFAIHLRRKRDKVFRRKRDF